jgi:hypothetical protein
MDEVFSAMLTKRLINFTVHVKKKMTGGKLFTFLRTSPSPLPNPGLLSYQKASILKA